jgi:hypothetical protein
MPPTPASEPLDQESVNCVVWRLMPILTLGYSVPVSIA